MAPRAQDEPRPGGPCDAGRPELVGAVVFAVVSLLLIATASLAPAGHAATSRGTVPTVRVLR